MATPRKRRLTKGDSYVFVRDASGEVLVRCLFCNADPYPLKQHWGHICDKDNLRPPPEAK